MICPGARPIAGACFALLVKDGSPRPSQSPGWTLADKIIDIVCLVFVVGVLGYGIYRSFRYSADRGQLTRRCIYSALLLLLSYGLFLVPGIGLLLFIPPLVVIAFLWLPDIVSKWWGPLLGVFDGGTEEVTPKPYYYLAEGKRRKGLYQEAIVEVQKQLEKFPGDYEGYVKLASIQVEHLKDLPAAEATLNEFLAFPDRATGDIVGALHLLADWQLQFGHNAQAATRALQRIQELYPNTPLAHGAEQRIAHLTDADETARLRREGKFTVKQGERNVGLRRVSVPLPATNDPRNRAAEYVKKLEVHPFDTETRERLALLYAEEFQRVDLAADQLEQLIALTNETPKNIARWLNLLATIYVKQAGNRDLAERALRRIIERFPGSAAATMAATRLATLQSEMKAVQTVPTKALENYERNIGLRQSGAP